MVVDTRHVIGGDVVDEHRPFPVVNPDGSSIGSGGSGPVTVADGADVTQGSEADAAWDGSAGTATVVALLKYIGQLAAAVASPYFNGAADETPANIKASAGNLTAIEVSNPDNADYFLQLFDADAGDVNLGTTTPVQSFLISAGDGSGGNGGMDKAFTVPLAFSTAISFAVTTTPTGSTGPSTSVVVSAQYV